MSKVLKIFIIFVFSNIIINSQVLTENEKINVINNLKNVDSLGSNRSNDAILKVIKYKINEAVPELEEYFSIQNNFGKTYFLKALNMFHSPNVNSLAIDFLNSLNLDKRSERRYVFRILNILFGNSDNSKYQLALDELNRNAPILNAQLLNNLSYLAKNIPVAKEEAINGIKKVAMESDNHYYRWYAFNELNALLGKNIIPFLLERIPFENTHSPSTAIYKLLGHYKDQKINTFIKEQLQLEYNKYVYEALLFVLVQNYNTIENYNFIKNLFESNPSKFSGYVFNSFLFKSEYVREPNDTITNNVMLDTLTSYTNQSYGYEWLKDEPYKNELLTKLTTAKTKLSSGDSLGCRTEIASFQNSVNQVYQDSSGSYPKYVSNAGYKFMYHYAQYILDKLPEVPTVEGLPVKLEDSQGNKKQQGDKIDHNTKEKIK